MNIFYDTEVPLETSKTLPVCLIGPTCQLLAWPKAWVWGGLLLRIFITLQIMQLVAITHPPTSTHYYEFTSPPEVWDLLVSDASWYHHREAQNHSPEHSRSPFLAGGMIFPPPSGMLDPCQFSSNNWKLISFNSTWLHKKNKIIINFHFFKFFQNFLFIFLSFPC